MIRNARQYRITQAQAMQLEQALGDFSKCISQASTSQTIS